MKKKLDNKGITLIALIITIVVLLILAAIAINTLFGEKGILEQAKKAKEVSYKKQIEEEQTLNRLYEETLIENDVQIRDIPMGWTLGNTFDCDSILDKDVSQYETAWGNPVTTREMINAVKQNGFETIRIPVTWFNHIDADNTIHIDWLNRIEEVVNYALDNHMYVILNTHHDDKKLDIAQRNRRI